MNNYKMIIRLVVAKNRKRQDNSIPIYVRITYHGKRKQFSSGQYISYKNWNSKQQLVEPPEPDAQLKNTQLSLIKTKLSQAFLFLQVKGSDFNVEDIYRQYKGETNKNDFGVMEVYHLHTAKIKMLIGIDIKQVTYEKYVESGRHLQSFIKHKYKSNDTQIKRLKSSFLEQYDYFLKTEKKLQQSTINKAIQRFRKVIKFAIAEDYLVKNPFLLYRPKKVKKELVYLSPEQLKTLEETIFKTKRLEYIKDLFVFCCYTGLGFKEMKELKHSDISLDAEGNKWLTIHRNKTERNYKVVILPKAEKVLLKYSDSNEARVFPSISNANFNAYLKEIAAIIGVEFNLTHHVARKTFATTVLLYNGVSMDVVSKLLGHRKLQTTQEHYGEILTQRISMELEKLKGSD